MDNNQQSVQPPSPAAPPTPAAPLASNPEAPQNPGVPPQPEIVETAGGGKSGSGSKIFLIIIALIFLGLLAAGAFYYYQMRQTAVQNAPSPLPVATASPDPLVEETQNITVEDMDGQFVEIDEDLQQL